MDKAPDAFRTISEVAEELDIPQHVLRFWETRFAQIKPMKRSGGRRYYRPDDVDLLRGIRRLLYGEGYTIRGVQRILKEEFGIAQSLAATYQVLHRLALSWLAPRPRHPRSDATAQESFRQALLLNLNASETSTPRASGLKSGSPTRRASVRRIV